jgi:hypothetical protein
VRPVLGTGRDLWRCYNVRIIEHGAAAALVKDRTALLTDRLSEVRREHLYPLLTSVTLRPRRAAVIRPRLCRRSGWRC